MFLVHFRLHLRHIYSEARQRNQDNLTSGVVYLETKYDNFPSAGWNDRILTATGVWMGNALNLIDSAYGIRKVTNDFMDGPYSFDVQKIDEDYVLITCIKNGKAEEERLLPVRILLKDYFTVIFHLGEGIMNDPLFPQYETERKRVLYQKLVASMKKWV